MDDWTKITQISCPADAIDIMVGGGICSALGHVEDAEAFANTVVNGLNPGQYEMLLRRQGIREISKVLIAFAKTWLLDNVPEVQGVNRRVARDELSLNEQFGRI